MTKLREIRLTDRIAARMASRTATVADREEGMSTVEYTIGVVAAGCGAGLLFKILSGPPFQQMVKELIMGAIKKMVPGF